MHPQLPPLTIAGTLLKESDELVILGVTFDSKMTFEKNLRSVYRATSLGAAWSTAQQCGARLSIHILNYWTAQSVVQGF